MDWQQLKEYIDSMSPEQRAKPVTIWDANNDAVLVVDAVDIRGKELEDDLAPVDSLDLDQPYLIVGIN